MAPLPWLVAFQRFGLGAKPNATLSPNAKDALRAEVLTPRIALIIDPSLPTYEKACFESQMGSARSNAVYVEEIGARVDKQMQVPIGFVERLILFWQNHFAMNLEKGEVVRGTVGQWERSAIRRNVLGKFYHMLHQTYEHPAMMAFLDNDDSVGPNSTFGKRFERGLNLNQARELLELHTLGSQGGYKEADVVQTAKVLSGWSYVRGPESDRGINGGTPQNRGRFIYRSDWHEPGQFKIMGRIYPAVGKKQLEQLLLFLAKHPSTAEHIAYKLVRHFITDNPTPAMVEPLKQKYLQTNGDLKAVALALLDLPESWSTDLNKIRTPYEFMLAQYRALGKRYQGAAFGQLGGPLALVGHSCWRAPTPEGYPDETASWLNPDAIRVRLDINRYQSLILEPGSNRNVVDLAQKLFGAGLSARTRQAIIDARAAFNNSNAAIVVLFSSPEFQRR